jgi:hypothetical protein
MVGLLSDPNPFPSDLRLLRALCTTDVAFLRRPRRFLGNSGTSLRFSDSVASPLASAFSAPGGRRDESPQTPLVAAARLPCALCGETPDRAVGRQIPRESWLALVFLHRRAASVFRPQQPLGECSSRASLGGSRILFFPPRTSAIISTHDNSLRSRIFAHWLARVRVCSSGKSARTGGGPCACA